MQNEVATALDAFGIDAGVANAWFFMEANPGLAVAPPSAEPRLPYASVGIVSGVKKDTGGYMYGVCVLSQTETNIQINVYVNCRTDTVLSVFWRLSDNKLLRLDTPKEQAIAQKLGPDLFKKFISTAAAVFFDFMQKLETGTATAHIATAHPTNTKRVRNGKKPLFTWTTVDIRPPKARAEPRGGHHASPRLHERRGHYRTLRSGVRVWVKNCKVGSAKNGVGFHDYRISNGKA